MHRQSQPRPLKTAGRPATRVGSSLGIVVKTEREGKNKHRPGARRLIFQNTLDNNHGHIVPRLFYLLAARCCAEEAKHAAA